jgi:hypothetical protein
MSFWGRLISWINGKPKRWENISEAERQQISIQNRNNGKSPNNSVDGDGVFDDAFGSAQVNPNSSQIGATTNQRGLGAVMSRRLFEPRKSKDD